MFKKTFKLISLLLLLIVSFIYTDKVFYEARENSYVMKEITKYKNKVDIKPIEPKIKGDELILGYSGLLVNKKESYNNMKKEDKFDKDKIVYDNKLPNKTITKNYNYYVKGGNPYLKKVSIIFKVNKDDNIDNLINKKDKLNFFVDGSWLEENTVTAFNIINNKHKIYNLGYNLKYDKTMIRVTNNLIKSISLEKSLYCLNDNKIDEYKNICANKKMITITSNLINPTILELKQNLSKGIIITYDVNTFDITNYNLIINIIKSRGYEIDYISNIVKE